MHSFKKEFICFAWERSGSVVECLTRGRGFKPPRRHCVVSLSKNTNPSLVLVQPRKIHSFPAGTLLCLNIDSMLIQCHDIVSTLSQSCVPAGFINERLLIGLKESNQN